MTTLDDLERRVARLEADAQARDHALEQGFAALGFGINAGLAAFRDEVAGRFDEVAARFDQLTERLGVVDAQLRRMENWQAGTDTALAEILRRLPEAPE